MSIKNPTMKKITAREKANLAAVNACVAYRNAQPRGIASKEDMLVVYDNEYHKIYNGLANQNTLV